MSSGADTLLITEQHESGVVVLRLNRPHVRNALNLALRRELATAFSALAQRGDVRCVVLTGTATAFCAGADLNEYIDATTIEVLQRNMHLLWGAIAQFPQPIIAAVQGYALGGGCELAMHADIIVAGESAVFGQPEVRVGLMPGAGATQRLTRAVGKFAAMKVLLTGCPIGAREALASGLVSTVVPDDQVFNDAMKLAKDIAQLAPLAVRMIKETVIESMNCTLESGLRLERKSFQILFSSSDKREGIRAFLEKRRPDFQGR